MMYQSVIIFIIIVIFCIKAKTYFWFTQATDCSISFVNKMKSLISVATFFCLIKRFPRILNIEGENWQVLVHYWLLRSLMQCTKTTHMYLRKLIRENFTFRFTQNFSFLSHVRQLSFDTEAWHSDPNDDVIKLCNLLLEVVFAVS